MREENRAYVLVKVSSGKDLEVFERVRDLQKDCPITEIATVYGDYDLITKIQFKKTEAAKFVESAK